MDLIEQLIEAGRVLWEEGLVTSHGGNLSARLPDGLVITKTGTKLGFLKRKDFIEVKQNCESCGASSELVVHSAIYNKTDKKFVVHAHPFYAVLLSLYIPEIKALDVEGKTLFGSCPVIEVEKATASPELAQAVSEALRKREIVVIKGHGSFAASESLQKAVYLTSSLEFSAKLLFASQVMKALL